MAAKIPEIGTGATITFDSGFFARINSIDLSGVAREPIETTHLGTSAARDFVPGDLYDPGELTVSLQHGLDTALPVMNGAEEAIVINFPGTSTWTGAGFMTSYDFNIALEERIDATCTLKFSGTLAQADA